MSRTGPEDTITVRALNRATLARQVLLARQRVTPLRALARLVGLQAQWPRPPQVALWTRLERFDQAAFTRLLTDHRVVRATLMRATLHLATAADYAPLRATARAIAALRGIRHLKGKLVFCWEDGSTIIFGPDGSYRGSFGRLDPALCKDFVALMRAIEVTPTRYSRNATMIVLSMDAKALRRSTADLPKYGPGTVKGDTVDLVVTYVLSGDILQTTLEEKASKYVRVK
jgi:Winged helix DNA-binding domain